MKEISLKSTINQRVKYIMDQLEYEEGNFSRKVGVSKGALINVIKNNEDPSYALLRNITTVFPVSQKWLLLGEGKPWTKDNLEKFKAGDGYEESHHEVDTDVNARFKEVRSSNDFSQTIFASELGVTRDVVAGIENNRTSPTISMVKTLHSRFGVNPMWLIYGDTPMYFKKKGA
jgi:DNA-binding XRE family transcriptional regulator